MLAEHLICSAFLLYLQWCMQYLVSSAIFINNSISYFYHFCSKIKYSFLYNLVPVCQSIFLSCWTIKSKYCISKQKLRQEYKSFRKFMTGHVVLDRVCCVQNVRLVLLPNPRIFGNLRTWPNSTSLYKMNSVSWK